MLPNLRLGLIFYRSIFAISFLFSAASVRFVQVNGWPQALNVIFIKIVGYALVVGYHYFFTPNVFYYYRNTGILMRTIYQYALGLDVLILSLMLFIYYMVAK